MMGFVLGVKWRGVDMGNLNVGREGDKLNGFLKGHHARVSILNEWVCPRGVRPEESEWEVGMQAGWFGGAIWNLHVTAKRALACISGRADQM